MSPADALAGLRDRISPVRARVIVGAGGGNAEGAASGRQDGGADDDGIAAEVGVDEGPGLRTAGRPERFRPARPGCDAVDPTTLGPAGEPEHLGDVENVDDLCLDEEVGVAYIARHPDHKIERVPLEPGPSGPGRAVVAAGDPFTDHLIGPTSIHWGRAPGDYGRVAYVPTDGGVIKLPPRTESSAPRGWCASSSPWSTPRRADA
jgi:hypothetical protein